MSFFVIDLWRKLIGNPVQFPADLGWIVDTAIDNALPVGYHAGWTSSAGPTVYEDVFNVSGRGELTYLATDKPPTINSVNIQIRITIDGAVMIADLAGTLTTTGTSDGMVVSHGWSSDDANSRKGRAGSIKFNKSCQVEVKWSGTPGASETFGMNYMYWFT